MSKSKIFVFGFVGVVVFFSVLVGVSAQSDLVGDKIGVIVKSLKDAVNKELASGEFTQTRFGKFFSGESATRVQKLHDEASQQIDALIARPENQRQIAIAKIRDFRGDQNLMPAYKFTTPSAYDSNTPAEIYYVDANQYEINALNNNIIQFGPRLLELSETKAQEYKISPALSLAQLEKTARQIISKNTNINVDNLNPDQSNKEKTMYFFRWVDKTKELQGMYRFVQVGISVGGELASYTNTFSIN